MLGFSRRNLQLCDGITRREAIQVGGVSALGLSLPAFYEGRAVQGAELGRSFGQAKSVILFWLFGGPPQHETWDPKPEAPSQIRGEFNAIVSATPSFRRVPDQSHRRREQSGADHSLACVSGWYTTQLFRPYQNSTPVALVVRLSTIFG